MIRNPFRRGAAATEATDAESLQRNGEAERRQKLLFYGIGGALAVGAMAWILQPPTDPTGAADKSGKDGEVKVSTDDMVNRNMSEREWMALSEGQMEQYGNQIKGLEGNSQRIEQLEQQIQALQGEKLAMAEDGTRVLSAYEAENQQLRAQVAGAQQAPRTTAPGPNALYGPGSPGIYQQPGTPAGQAASGAALDASMVPEPVPAREIKLVAFTGAGNGTAERIVPGKTTSFTDSANYLPPNSIARARVVVGVDAPTSVRSQSDPLPVVLRITGPARSVYAEGRLLRTQIEGCMVNGAASGDLSSEKVYVRLQRMTCPQPGGRFAVSEVKGFIAFGGKTGVRGRVVSREGGLVGQAFIAGLAGGFGRGFSFNTESALNGSNVSVNGERQKLSLGEIAQGGVGSGVAGSADQVSKYLIERAEQYQPVIEMPTGIDVEIVFLDGVYVRNSQ